MIMSNSIAKNKNRFAIWLSAICIISNLSYYPTFQTTSYARLVVIGLWTALALYMLIVRPVKMGIGIEIKWVIWLYAAFVVNSIIILISGGEEVFTNHFFLPVTVAFIIFFSACQMGSAMSRADFRKVLLSYGYIMGILAVPLFFIYLRNTDLSNSNYGYNYGKNEIAVLLCCATIILAIIPSNGKKLTLICRVIMCLLMIIDTVLLRCRSVMMGYVFVLVTFVLRARISNGLRSFIIICIIAVTYYFIRNPGFLEFRNQIIFAGRNANSIDEISSGRVSQINEGLNVFLDNWLTGVGKRKTLDCFYISALANYGLLSWPIILTAILPLFWSINCIKDSDDLHSVFLIITLTLFILSIFEELAPYGPGTRCYILWLMWGFLICANHKSKSIDIDLETSVKKQYRYIR